MWKLTRYPRRGPAAPPCSAHLLGAAFVVMVLTPGWSPAASSEAQTGEEDVIGRQRESLRQTESAFARSFADQDLDRFLSFVADDAVFVGSSATLRGKEAVAGAWGRFFQEEAAPFAWEPTIVEVSDAADMGITGGPVTDPAGRFIGSFSSVWRRRADGGWEIIFDSAPPCAPVAP